MKIIHMYNPQGQTSHIVNVDDEEYFILWNYNWKLSEQGYAIRSGLRNGIRTTIQMHRQIMNCPDNMQVDHIDRNRLNNQKSNLKICTQNENLQNRVFKKRTTLSKANSYSNKIWHILFEQSKLINYAENDYINKKRSEIGIIMGIIIGNKDNINQDESEIQYKLLKDIKIDNDKIKDEHIRRITINKLKNSIIKIEYIPIGDYRTICNCGNPAIWKVKLIQYGTNKLYHKCEACKELIKATIKEYI